MLGLEDDRDAIAAPQLPGPAAHPRGGRLGPVGGIRGFTELFGQTAFTRALEPHYGYDYTLPAFGLLDCSAVWRDVGQVNQIDCVATRLNWATAELWFTAARGNKLAGAAAGRQRRARVRRLQPGRWAHLYADARRWPRRSQRAVSSACGGGLGSRYERDLTQRQLLDRLVLDRLLTVARYLAARATVADVRPRARCARTTPTARPS